MPSPEPPPAEGVRLDWEHLPVGVRAMIEEHIGDSVVEATTQRGGFSPGLAARLRTADGLRVFVKAVSEDANPDSPKMHRREAQIVAALPAGVGVPRLLWSDDRDGWVVLGFEDVDGRMPGNPWLESDLRLIGDALNDLHRRLTPSPVAARSASDVLTRYLNGWKQLLAEPDSRLDRWTSENLSRLADLEARAPEAAAGQTLVQFDLRADNILIAGERVFFVDWPHARVGAAFVDWVAFAPSVEMQGGPRCETLLAMANLEGVAEEAVDAVICSLAGFFVRHSLLPPPPGLPTLRAFQAAQGEVAVRWLRDRSGW